MITPSCERIQELAKDYTVIPICKEIYADVVTPITLLRRLAKNSKQYYLLESVEGGEKWGRYSFLGYNPVMRISCKESTVTIREQGKEDQVIKEEGLQVLKDILTKYRAPKIDGFPPFTGGLVGFFAYAMIAHAEPTLSIKRNDSNDYDMMLFDKVIAFDHLRQKISILVNMKTESVMENYGKAVAEIEKMQLLITNHCEVKEEKVDNKISFSCNVSEEEYTKMVNRTKEYIVDGDIFQAVISRRFESPFEGSLIDSYRVLRTTNPSPYMVYMNLGEEEIISTSPETLVRLEDGRLTTFPVAGSRPRGKDDKEDNQLEAELLADEKELSEHNMLVDLGRNDLGRISKYGTVEVSKYKMIHKYSKIMHICSQVEGDIRDDQNAIDALSAVLPAGTLSGAPKIRACEIIDELEPEARGVYGGALGYMDFSGNMDTCIAIRMAVKHGGKVVVQAGGGIVADSVPKNEYEESANKAKAVMEAIMRAREVYGE